MNRESLIMTAPLGIDSGKDLRSGLIVASNESRFSSTEFSTPLTAYSVGWKDPENLEDLLEYIAPAVDVNRRFEWKKANNDEAFLTETDDVRSIGSAFKRVDFSGTSVDSKTHNKGLTIRVDKDDEVGSDWQERYVGFLMQRLLRNEVRRAIAILDTAATNVGKIFSAATNPDGFMREALRLGKNASGIRPNRVLAGGAAWDLRADAYEAQDNPYAGRAAGMTPEDLARKLMVEGVKVSEAVYTAGANAKADIIGSILLFFYGRSGMMKDEPSNIKRFVSPTAKGGRRAVYIEDHAKYTDLTVEHYSNTTITSPTGIRKITATAA